jgi:hypothetical protein
VGWDGSADLGHTRAGISVMYGDDCNKSVITKCRCLVLHYAILVINVKKTYSLNIELRTMTNYTCKTANI